MDSSVLTAISTIVVAAIAGLTAWGAGRRKGSADAQHTINDGYKSLVKQLQEYAESAETRGNKILSDLQNERQRAQICQSELHVEIRKLGVEIISSRADVKLLEANITMFENILKENHIEFKALMSR
jgi:hypothetical protein